MTNTKKTAVTIAISQHWQIMFITVSVLSWLWPIAETAYLYGSNGYINSGTWTFTITLWLLPICFFGIAYTILQKYTGWLQRLFMACLATMIGMTSYSIGAGVERNVWVHLYQASHPISPSDTSLWSAFGNDWIVMVIGLVLFAAGLYLAVNKSRR